jgi:hypothetical protein
MGIGRDSSFPRRKAAGRADEEPLRRRKLEERTAAPDPGSIFVSPDRLLPCISAMGDALVVSITVPGPMEVPSGTVPDDGTKNDALNGEGLLNIDATGAAFAVGVPTCIAKVG